MRHSSVPRETLSSHGSELNTVAIRQSGLAKLRPNYEGHGIQYRKAAIKTDREAAIVLVKGR
jgi:hypothetical protein